MEILNCGDILVNYSKLRKISRYLTVQSRMEILIGFEFRGILRHMFKLRFLFDFNVQLTKIPHHSGFRLPFNSSDGFFRKDYGNRNRKQFAPAVVFFAKQGTETERTYGPVAPRGRRRAIFFWDVVAHRRACLLEFLIKISRVSSTQKSVFRRRSFGDLSNLRSGSQIFDKCMCHVNHDVCGVCGEDWQVGHSKDKSNWFSLFIILLLVVLRFEYSKFELFVGDV